jgi:nitrate/nitrite transport system substrate-binding protein
LGDDPDLSINGETDAMHMLTPTAGDQYGPGLPVGALRHAGDRKHFGQAITLANKHKGVKEAKEMKGFKFCVPSTTRCIIFAALFSRRRRIDRWDVQIRVVPPMRWWRT